MSDITFDLFNYTRRKSSEVYVGNTPLGAANPIRVQSMTNTSTMDTLNSVAQCIRIIEAGGEYVRLTAQGEREAFNLKQISEKLREAGYETPLVADIHFNPKAAETAAHFVEKVRINPGNFVDSARTFKQLSYTDEEYAIELQRLRDRFIPLLEICREHHTALRIGVNHGSLSDRIMSRYGDTPFGMVESCMEFLRICKSTGFNDVVISVKASNTVVMVQTVRLLVATMQREAMNYPLHLGVTEAGDGEEGRIKSAVGIGALLNDGIGDTIRVSLSEEPELEIPVACKLVNYIRSRENHAPIQGVVYEPFEKAMEQCVAFNRLSRKSGTIKHTPLVIVTGEQNVSDGLRADVVLPDGCTELDGVFYYRATYEQLTDECIDFLKTKENVVLMLESNHVNRVGEWRAAIHRLMCCRCDVPVVLAATYREEQLEDLQLKAAADMGVFFIDGLADGICLKNEGNSISEDQLVQVAFSILQATRSRITRVEYISCPSCGRTMFDLQQTIARIKSATAHLKGLKIGIMGCIVNGPGEMADADYGYVGAARGKVSLYKKKECIEKNIAEADAVDKLIDLIKKHGDWHEKND